MHSSLLPITEFFNIKNLISLFPRLSMVSSQRSKSFLAAAFLSVFFLNSCALLSPPPPLSNETYEGIASWYGDDFHGKKTSSGERYNMYMLTAASRTIPLGSKVRVTRVDNGKSIVVKVNDRGPFVGGRIIDLSYQAARRLDMLEEGLATVRLVVLSQRPDVEKPVIVPIPSSDYWVSCGIFSLERTAVWLEKQLKPDFKSVIIRSFSVEGSNFYQVRMGPYQSPQETEKILKELARIGLRGFIEQETSE